MDKSVKYDAFHRAMQNPSDKKDKHDVSEKSPDVSYPGHIRHNNDKKNSNSKRHNKYDRVNLLEKRAIKTLIVNIKAWREETKNDNEAEKDKALVKENFKFIDEIISIFFESKYTDNPIRLSEPEMTSAKNQLKQGDFADALVTLLSARDGLYGIEL